MSKKYGVGYLLSNGNYGVSFNDGTSLTKINLISEDDSVSVGNYLYYNGQ